MTLDFRDIGSISAATVGTNKTPRGEIEELLRGLDTPLLVDELVAGWATPALNGDEDAPGVDYLPGRLRTALGRKPAENGALSTAMNLLRGRALAIALARCTPAWSTWQRCVDSFQSSNWDGFAEQLGKSLTEAPAAGPTWLAVLTEGPPSLAEAVLAIDGEEKSIVEETSRAWLACPTAFSPSILRGYFPLASAVHAALAFLLVYNPQSWFEALRRAKLPTIVAASVDSVAHRLDQVLALLRQAPIAIAAGSETRDIAGTLLARSALGYPARAEAALRSAGRAAAREQRQVLEQAIGHFETQVLHPMVEEVVAEIAGRPDGEELAPAMLLELVAKASRQPLRAGDRSTETKILHACASRVEGVFEVSPGEALWRWSESSAVASSHAGLIRYLASVLVTPSPPGTGQISAKDAGALWTLFRRVLHSGSRSLQSYSDAFTVPSWVFPTASLPLACLDEPLAAFEQAFSDLEPERMEESGKRDYESRSLGSRTLVHVASAAAGCMANDVVRLHPQSEREEFCDAVWRSVRRLWLRAPLQVGEDIDHLVLNFFVWLPRSLGLQSEFVAEALSFLLPDPDLTIEVARVWYQNGADPSEIASVFETVGQPLEDLLEAIEGASGYWSPPEQTVRAVRVIVEGIAGEA